MKSPEAVRAALATRYRRQEWRWLRAALLADIASSGTAASSTTGDAAERANAAAIPATDARPSFGTLATADVRNTATMPATGAASTGETRVAADATEVATARATDTLDPDARRSEPPARHGPTKVLAPDDRTDGAPVWPLRLALGAPDERRALSDPDALRTWLDAWHRRYDGPGTVIHVTRRWKTLGRQTLPTHLVLDDPAALADAIGQGQRWRRLLRRARELARAAPERLDTIGALLTTLETLDDSDWSRWRDTADWLAAHPDSGLYPRQLPIAGVDTKTLEHWRASLERWLVGNPRHETSHDTGSTAADRDALGLRRLPVRVRALALDPTLPGWPRGLGDIELPTAELAALPLRPGRVLVVENLQSGLALPPLSDTLAIVALGYALEPLTDLPWLSDTPIDYWGDIDTHGLAMLARLRRRFPQTRSLFMDEATLLAHRDLWVEETRPSAAAVPDGLTGAEAVLYDDLVRGRWGNGVRLEQERIEWPRVLRALGAAHDGRAGC